MFSTRWQFLRLWGIPIRVDASWLIVVALATWTLADRFHEEVPGQPSSAYWTMGLITALTFFACNAGAISLPPDADALEALERMQRTGSSQLLVTDNGRLVGVVSLKDLLRILRLKLELEPEGDDLKATELWRSAGYRNPAAKIGTGIGGRNE